MADVCSKQSVYFLNQMTDLFTFLCLKWFYPAFIFQFGKYIPSIFKNLYILYQNTDNYVKYIYYEIKLDNTVFGQIKDY